MAEIRQNIQESDIFGAEQTEIEPTASTIHLQQDPRVLAAIAIAIHRNAKLYNRIDSERSQPSVLQQYLSELGLRLAAFDPQ